MSEPRDDAFTITVGPASFDVRHGRHTDAINEPDTASGTVVADDIKRSAVDWAGSARAAIGSHSLMTGHVIEALPDGDGSVALSLRSALVMTESLMPPMLIQNLTPSEVVYGATRSAGFRAADVHIDGLDGLQAEPMWVVAPVDGVCVKRAVHVGVVEFIAPDQGWDLLRRFSPPLEPAFTEPAEGATAFARVPVVARLTYDAEDEGLALIDTAVAWLTTRLRYSWSHGPDGSLQHYERAPTRVSVRRRDGVAVLAIDSPRRWWRTGTTVERHCGEVTLTSSSRWMEPPLPASIAPADRQALLALQRAATATDPVQRVGALWEAIEFYVGGRTQGRLFERRDVAEIVERAANGLADEQAARVEEVLRKFLNQPSITARLKHVLAEEEVPFTRDDLALLASVRRERNLALHGDAAAPEHDDIDRAVAFMSRAIAARWHHARGPERHS
ncbi:MAG TPA: hypothetical protein VGM91_19065 [Conexibacter sp.]|jgi:hypothetical protein